MESVAVIGAGTMGAGIAQVAAVAGWTVHLRDVDDAVVGQTIEGIRKRLDRLVEKERLAADERDAAAARLHVASDPAALDDCTLVIEAIVEKLDVKTDVLRSLVATLPDEAIIATNTSSLSISELGAAIGEARRTVGMHFFNPAPLMKLVEVIAGGETDPAVIDRVRTIAETWGKKVARAADVPGFIVNHVARPYYLEAFRILEDGYATPDEVDTAMKTLGGFRMGPFELTDLIGQDVNVATTRSVWERLDQPPLLHPSEMQEQLVRDGHLGRKTGRGVYIYQDDKQQSGLDIEHAPLHLTLEAQQAIDTFEHHGSQVTGTPLQSYIFCRILAALIVQAAHAHTRGVAEQGDIDTAMRFGVNYPRGPFEWLERIGRENCVTLLKELGEHTGDVRFAVPVLLEQMG